MRIVIANIIAFPVALLLAITVLVEDALDNLLTKISDWGLRLG